MYMIVAWLRREHQLHRYISIMSRTYDCVSMYEERSFLRDKTMLRYVIHGCQLDTRPSQALFHNIGCVWICRLCIIYGTFNYESM